MLPSVVLANYNVRAQATIRRQLKCQSQVAQTGARDAMRSRGASGSCWWRGEKSVSEKTRAPPPIRSMSSGSESDPELPEHAEEQAHSSEEEESAEPTAETRTFGAALKSLLADKSTGGPALAPGTQRKRTAESKKRKEAIEARETKRRLLEKDRVMPEPTAAAYERKLMKVATKGVVRFFNAVSAQKAAHKDEGDGDEEENGLTTAKTKAGTRSRHFFGTLFAFVHKQSA